MIVTNLKLNFAQLTRSRPPYGNHLMIQRHMAFDQWFLSEVLHQMT